MTNTQFYHHRPLSSPRFIRVVDLQPARSSKAPIKCTLSEVDLDSLAFPAPYEALSYVWGDRVGTIPVMCHDKQLLVTPNCRDALLQLRKSSRTRRLFIDAICIDQREGGSSQEEREQQIKLIGQVYAKAAKVNIWLGPSRKFTSRLFKLMKVMHWRDKPKEHWFADPGPLHAVVKRAISIHDNMHSKSSSLGEEFRQVAEYPWFTRTWTIQEQVLAGDACLVLCGNQQMRWVVFRSALDSLRFLFDFSAIINGTAENLRSRIALKYELNRASKQDPATSYEPTFNIAIWMATRNLNSTIPQDKIFGIYNLITQLGIDVPEPDYSMTEADLYEKTTRAIILATGSLGLLMLCTRPDSDENLPSWVPDWSTKISTIAFPDLGVINPFINKDYDSAKDTRVTQRAIQQGILSLKGVIIGNIDFLSGPPYIEMLDGDTYPRFYAFADACRRWCQRVASSSPDPNVMDAVRRTLLFMFPRVSAPEYEAQQSYDKFASFDAWYDLMLYPDCAFLNVADLMARAERHRQSLNPRNWDPQMDPSVELISLIFNGYDRKRLDEPQNEIPYTIASSANYALMILDTGHFVRGFYGCKQNDVVALLAGSEVPVALRPDGSGRCKFVAPLYVDGIMFGEAWPEDESELVDIVLV
ncbi:heterokaryon incompatibility protein-domain-containing protein [Nemania abortiva]|nr:heterokaryon incompatibility protein-domain-containing protein [Nemania abortiva]